MTDPNSQRVPCVLCGDAESKITLEHIYGDWMAEEFPEQERNRKRAYIYQDPTTGKPVQKAWSEKQQRHQTQLRVLCETCNRKWGSRLESAVKPLLVPMIRGESAIRTKDEVISIATWAAKIAVLREFLDPPEMRIIPTEHRYHLRLTNEPPPNMLIVAGSIQANMRWAHRDRHSVLVVTDDPPGSPPPPGVPANTYLSTFGFGRMFLLVCGVLGETTPAVDVSLHFPELFVRIWPAPGGFVWPTREPVDDRGLDDITGAPIPLFQSPDDPQATP